MHRARSVPQSIFPQSRLKYQTVIFDIAGPSWEGSRERAPPHTQIDGFVALRNKLHIHKALATCGRPARSHRLNAHHNINWRVAAKHTAGPNFNDAVRGGQCAGTSHNTRPCDDARASSLHAVNERSVRVARLPALQ